MTDHRFSARTIGQVDAKDFGRRVADSLTHDMAPTQEMLLDRTFGIGQSDPVSGCWTFAEYYVEEFGPRREWTRKLWDSYVAIAQHLFAMPMPTDE